MMEFVEREVGFLVAMARSIVDERKTQRAESARPFSAESMIDAAEKNGILQKDSR